MTVAAMHTDLGFGRTAARKQSSAKAAKQPHADVGPGRIAGSDLSLRKENVADVAMAALVLVPAGTVVRVVQSHKMERRSQFIDQYLHLDRER